MRGSHTSAAAYTIATLSQDWSGRLPILASTITAEVAAITKDLRALVRVPPSSSLILSDSKDAEQRVSMPSQTDNSPHTQHKDSRLRPYLGVSAVPSSGSRVT